MNSNPVRESFEAWLYDHMRLGQKEKSGRLVVLLATLERLRSVQTLDESSHLTKSKQQLIAHDRHVASGLGRYGLTPPVEAGGRRASNVNAWLRPLFEYLRENGFDGLTPDERDQLLSAMGELAANRIRSINEEAPLICRFNRGSIRAVVADILDQAQSKNRAKDVAEYLIGAKLEQLYGPDVVEPKDVNTPSDPADFQIGTSAIEVTVSAVDVRHLAQIKSVLDRTTLEFWLIVRYQDRTAWQDAVDKEFDDARAQRVVVMSIEEFLCINVAERGKFDSTSNEQAFTSLFEIYNNRWIPQAGGGAIRIVSGNPDSGAD